VIESRRRPTARGVAKRAIGGEPGRNVIRVRRPGEIRLVAGIAGSRRVRVIVVCMALGAGQRGMSSGQRIVGIHCVIEVDVGPVRRRMAGVAGRGKPGSRMARVCRSVPIRLVAAVAGRGQRAVVVIGVALRAGQCRVCSR